MEIIKLRKTLLKGTHFEIMGNTLVYYTLTHHVTTVGLLALLIANLASRIRHQCTSMKTIQLYSLNIKELPKNRLNAQTGVQEALHVNSSYADPERYDSTKVSILIFNIVPINKKTATANKPN
jgi:hypothetical protein